MVHCSLAKRTDYRRAAGLGRTAPVPYRACHVSFWPPTCARQAQATSPHATAPTAMHLPRSTRRGFCSSKPLAPCRPRLCALSLVSRRSHASRMHKITPRMARNGPPPRILPPTTPLPSLPRYSSLTYSRCVTLLPPCSSLPRTRK